MTLADAFTCGSCNDRFPKGFIGKWICTCGREWTFASGTPPMASLADELEKLAGEATAGPWEVNYSSIAIAGSGAAAGYPSVPECIASLNDGEYIENGNYEADATLIVALRNNLDTILSALREREAVVAFIRSHGEFYETDAWWWADAIEAGKHMKGEGE